MKNKRFFFGVVVVFVVLGAFFVFFFGFKTVRTRFGVHVRLVSPTAPAKANPVRLQVPLAVVAVKEVKVGVSTLNPPVDPPVNPNVEDGLLSTVAYEKPVATTVYDQLAEVKNIAVGSHLARAVDVKLLQV